MEKFIKEWCKYWDQPFDETIQQYNSNTTIKDWIIDRIINYKIKNNKDIIYKEDIPKIVLKIHGLSQEKFMKKVMNDIKYNNLDINSLTFKDCTWYLWFYYLSTFLDNEPVDIKIALKD